MKKSTSELAPLQIELREAMTDWGCPLCRLSAKAEKAYIKSLNYERVLDIKTRDAIKASRGLCERHSRDWEELQGSALGIAIVYRVTVLDLLRDTEPAKLPQQSIFNRQSNSDSLSELLEAHGSCVACDIGEGTAKRFTGLLIQDLKNQDLGDQSLQELLVGCGGLCLPHLRTALLHRMCPTTYDALIAVQRKAWQNIMGELEEFIRKNDYRFQDEVLTGGEGTSWSRVLDVIVGKR